MNGEFEPAEPLTLIILAAIGVVAGAVNTVAGAGSLLLLPALVFSGLPDDAANATNRVGILAQTAMAVWGFRRAGLTVGKSEAALSGVVMAGGVVGSVVATLLSAGSMRIAILVAMGTMLVLSLVPPRRREQTAVGVPGATGADGPSGAAAASSAADIAPAPGSASLRRPVEATPLVALGLALVGVYGGFLQAGVGILVLLFLTHASTADLVTANVLKSTATLGLTLVALVVFGLAGETIDPARGLALAVGSGLGGAIGARATVALGERFVRVTVVVAVSAAMARLLWDTL